MKYDQIIKRQKTLYCKAYARDWISSELTDHQTTKDTLLQSIFTRRNFVWVDRSSNDKRHSTAKHINETEFRRNWQIIKRQKTLLQSICTRRNFVRVDR